MGFDEELGERVGLALDRFGVIYETKKMMGGLCFMVDDKMLLAVVSDDLMVRLSPEEVERGLEEHGCRPMDFTGRPMKGFLFVEAELVKLNHALESWIKRALAFNPFAKRSKKKS